MTSHLSPAEFSDMLDGVLPPARRAHVDACAVCRLEHDQMTALVAEAAAAEHMPEPAPIFWDRLSTNIQRQTTGADAPRPSWSSWRSVWAPIAAFGLVAAAAVFAISLRAPLRSPEVPSAESASLAGPAASIDAAGDDAQWALVAKQTASLSQDDVYQVASSVPTLDNAIQLDEFTPAERATFVELVQSEMGGGE